MRIKIIIVISKLWPFLSLTLTLFLFSNSPCQPNNKSIEGKKKVMAIVSFF